MYRHYDKDGVKGSAIAGEGMDRARSLPMLAGMTLPSSIASEMGRESVSDRNASSQPCERSARCQEPPSSKVSFPLTFSPEEVRATELIQTKTYPHYHVY